MGDTGKFTHTVQLGCICMEIFNLILLLTIRMVMDLIIVWII